MSEKKNIEHETTLIALDQLAQTLEVMNSLVKRLRHGLEKQHRHDDSTESLAQDKTTKPSVNPSPQISEQLPKPTLH